MPTFFNVNFEVATNEDFSHAFALADDANAAVDLSGASLKMDLVHDDVTALQLSTANGRITVVNAATGAFEIAIPQATLTTLPARYYRHDLLLQVNGHTHRIWEGGLNLTDGLTA